MHLVDSAYSSFTKQELERLAAYRAAVSAGFYTDWDGSAESTDADLLAWLPAQGGGQSGVAAYPFTVEERQRLERCRAALAAGAYDDDRAVDEPRATPRSGMR